MAKLTKEAEEIIISCALDNNFSPVFNYSGRGMMGSKCFGIIGEFRNLGSFISESIVGLISREVETDDWILEDDIFKDMHMDSMGKEIIFYWPNLVIDRPEDYNS